VPVGCAAIAQLSTSEPSSVYRPSTRTSRTQQYTTIFEATEGASGRGPRGLRGLGDTGRRRPADFLNRVRKFDSCRGHRPPGRRSERGGGLVVTRKRTSSSSSSNPSDANACLQATASCWPNAWSPPTRLHTDAAEHQDHVPWSRCEPPVRHPPRISRWLRGRAEIRALTQALAMHFERRSRPWLRAKQRTTIR
jgi:hypothetical protein